MRCALRVCRVPLLLGTLLLVGEPLGSPGTAPLFSIQAPRKMVTGSVLVQAKSVDPRVTLVKWCVDDWARTTPPPFDFVLDVGAVPAERRVRAIALDSDRRPLYERETTLNPGARGLSLSFLTPVAGQQASGATAVTLEALVPADDALDALELEAGDARLALDRMGGGEGLFGTVATLPPGPVPLVARLSTKRGRRAEATLVVNARGASASAYARVVEQMAGVARHGQPVLGLGPDDFTVRDERGACEVRSATLVTQTPLALGFAVDTSLSLRENMKLLARTADRFLSQCFRPADSGFVLAFGPVVSPVADWTSDREELRARLEHLPVPAVSGTALYEAVVKALYQFQGSQGARALILITDGYDFEGDVSEEDALAYARQSGVKIYALALETRVKTPLTGPNGPSTTEFKYSVVAPNLALLSRLAESTGGRALAVRKAEDLGPTFDRIERDLRTQYLVSFVSRAKERGAFHPVEIRSKRGQVTTAAGYFY